MAAITIRAAVLTLAQAATPITLRSGAVVESLPNATTEVFTGTTADTTYTTDIVGSAQWITALYNFIGAQATPVFSNVEIHYVVGIGSEADPTLSKFEIQASQHCREIRQASDISNFLLTLILQAINQNAGNLPGNR